VSCLRLGALAAYEKSRYDALRAEYEAFQRAGRGARLGSEEEKPTRTPSPIRQDRRKPMPITSVSTMLTLSLLLGCAQRRHPSSSFVPPPPPASSRPELACFDRADYSRADGSLLLKERADSLTRAQRQP